MGRVRTLLPGDPQDPQRDAGNPPCPVCDDEANHDWLECIRMARYELLELLDCKIALWPPMGPEEVLRLRREPLLWVEDDADGKPIVKSCLPPCHFCNHTNPAHFPLECAQVWEEWEKEVPILQVPATQS